MAAQWNTYFLEPLAIGGAGHLTAGVVDATTLVPAEAVRAFLGPVAATSEADTNAALVSVDLVVQTDGLWTTHIWGTPRVAGQVLSWFVRFGGVWSAGPVVPAVDLSTYGTSDFPWILDWMVDRLQEFAVDRPFGANRDLMVRRTYPRDVTGWPMVSVQLDSLTPAVSFTSGSEGTEGGVHVKGRIYSASISFVGWTDKPEDRSRVGQWLAEALAIVLDIAPHAGITEPTFNLSESEDFETLGIPCFLVNASFNCQLESHRTIPVRSGFGRITV